MTKRILLIGPAGSGKTHRILDEFEETLRNPKDPFSDDTLFILPSAEHTERIITLLVARGVKGFFHRRVTTLAHVLNRFFEIGDGPGATNVTRYLILREIFEKITWPVFEESQKCAGFLPLMLTFISELKESLIPAALFRQKMNALKRLEPDMAVKYEALADIYERYESGLTERGLRDSQDAFFLYQTKKKRGLIKPPHFRKIWLDGFFDFSGSQLAFLGELCECSEAVTVALTLDPSSPRRDLFAPLQHTEEILRSVGFKRVECPRRPLAVRLPEALSHVERHLFSLAPEKISTPGESLGILEAIGLEGEIEMIGRLIQSSVASGKYRYSDFAILLRQIGDYEPAIRLVFSRYGIPVEIHERERLVFSPILRVYVHLLKIFQEGWRRRDLLAFLKSSYVHFSENSLRDYEAACALEYQSLKSGIFQGRESWLSLGAVKVERPLKELAAFEDALRAAKSASQAKALLMEVQARFGIFTAQQDSCEDFARREATSLKRLEVLLEEIETSFRLAPETYGFDSFVERFFRLVELDLYSLHYRDKNRVQVYDVSLARQKEYRVVFLAGLVEKQFPVQIKEDPVLSDWERQLFNSALPQEGEGTLRGSLKERLPRQAMERTLFYVAVTRATERLFLSFPRLDLEGKESLSSPYVEEIQILFSNPLERKKQELSEPFPAPQEAVSLRELELAVMGRRDAERDALGLELLKRETSRQRFQKAFYQVKEEISDEKIVSLDAFRSHRTSASRLEEYAKCPFKYYAHRVLRLQDPEEDVNIFRRGLILHEVLQHFFEVLVKKPALAEERLQISSLMEEEIKKASLKYPFVCEKKYQLDLEREDLREILIRFLDFELARLSRSRFQPAYFEWDFGAPTSKVPPLEIQREDGTTVQIQGKVDRIDIISGKKVAAILDYKRTAKFERKSLELGIALQLPLYALAVEKLLGLTPAAAELYSLRELSKNGIYRQSLGPLLGELPPRRRVLSEEDFQAILERSIHFVRKFSKGMETAAISARPRDKQTCEAFCPYGAVCRIEKWRLPLILEEIKEEDLSLEENKSDVYHPEEPSDAGWPSGGRLGEGSKILRPSGSE